METTWKQVVLLFLTQTLPMPKRLVVFISLTLLCLAPLRAQSLSSLKWKNRILLLMDPEGETDNRNKQLLALQKLDSALKERDLLIFCYDGSTLLSRNLEPSPYHLPEQLDRNFQGVILLGKDGGVKLKTAYPVEPQFLFSLIDGMPMRKAEIRRSKKH